MTWLWWVAVAAAQDAGETGASSPDEVPGPAEPAAARAEDTTPEETPPEPAGEVVEPAPSALPSGGSADVLVESQQRVIQERKEFVAALEELGYEGRRRRDGKQTFVHPDIGYKPRVVLDDDGYMVIRRNLVLARVPDVYDWDNPLDEALEYALCLIPTWCLTSGALLSPPRLEQQKQLVVDATGDDLQQYQEALAQRGFQVTLAELPGRMDGIWHRGVDPVGGAVYATPEERRAALVGLWATRACDVYGDTVRQRVVDYMTYEVQPSSSPYTPEELAAAGDGGCGVRLVLPQ